jgi:hypothetical protein
MATGMHQRRREELMRARTALGNSKNPLSNEKILRADSCKRGLGEVHCGISEIIDRLQVRRGGRQRCNKRVLLLITAMVMGEMLITALPSASGQCIASRRRL